ncbi:MAG: MBL fold metallo-hydrolase, partial [Clostridiales bacterium]|nr:MBL fold metallo-hydrolase [Clostridiales bacterium]
ILLDTGASESFMDNADALDKDLSKVDFVVLSHGHSDHSGGIRTLCASTRKKFQLIMNPRFFEKKFKKEGECLKYIGNDFNEEFLRIENVAAVFPLTDTFALMDGVYILSGFARSADFEDEPNDFLVLNGGRYMPDTFADEQVLVADLPDGLAVITGCAHTGIVNICEAIKKRVGKPIYAVIGGIHLKDSGDERVNKTVSYMREEGIRLLALGHCTGDQGLSRLEAAGAEIREISSGSVIEMEG